MDVLQDGLVGMSQSVRLGNEVQQAGNHDSKRVHWSLSAKLIGYDPWAYLKDILERLPPQPASRIQELLPHRG